MKTGIWQQRRKHGILLLLVVLLILTPAGLAPLQVHADLPGAAPHEFQKGLSYATWWSGQYRDPGADLSLAALHDTGANWISLIVTVYQDHYDSTTIDRTGAQTPTDEDLIHVIEQAHALGLQVMLKPHLDLADEFVSGLWRGDIGTGFTTEGQWAAWFAAYRDMIAHYAALAQAHGVDQFCIGTELLGTTHREPEWRDIVALVRSIYSGPLVYAALHSGEEQAITWWDAVDYIGVDAYYPLNDDPNIHPTVEELESFWAEPKAVLAGLYAAYGKPILFTEIGYRSHHGSTCHPWDSWAEAEVDLQEQANAYEATFRQVYDQPWLGGIFWWTWYADRFQSGPCDCSYSPKDKPAEDILRAWYGGEPRMAPPILIPRYDQALEIYVEELASDWDNWSWNATVDLQATDQVHEGSHSIYVDLSAWGALSLHTTYLDTTAYTWLEFYIRPADPMTPTLRVFFDAVCGTRLASVPVNHCRYLDTCLDPAGWTRVRIPLADLDADCALLSRLSIGDSSGAPAAFWVDSLRLVPGSEPAVRLFLPSVMVEQ